MRHDTPANIKEWPGYVILPAMLNFPQLIVWQDAIDAIDEIKPGVTWPEAQADPRLAEKVVKALCVIVQEWHLDKLPTSLSVESFPGTPRVQATLLIAWLCGLIAGMFSEAEDTPEKKDE